jgi:hypothetical protein
MITILHNIFTGEKIKNTSKITKVSYTNYLLKMTKYKVKQNIPSMIKTILHIGIARNHLFILFLPS